MLWRLWLLVLGTRSPIELFWTANQCAAVQIRRAIDRLSAHILESPPIDSRIVWEIVSQSFRTVGFTVFSSWGKSLRLNSPPYNPPPCQSLSITVPSFDESSLRRRGLQQRCLLKPCWLLCCWCHLRLPLRLSRLTWLTAITSTRYIVVKENHNDRCQFRLHREMD